MTRPVIVLIAVLLSCSQAEPREEWEISSIVAASDSTMPGEAKTRIIFKSGDTLVVPIRDAQVRGIIARPNEAPWLVLSGVECSACDGPEQLYFVRAASRSIVQPLRGYSFPGDHVEAGVGPEEPFFRSRAFVGKCAGVEAGVLLVEESLTESNEWSKSARVISLADSSRESQVTWNPSREAELVRALEDQSCKEIPGRKQYIL